MGIAAAPSYFQRVISTEVLGGLCGIICEVYIDDIVIVWGHTEAKKTLGGFLFFIG